MLIVSYLTLCPLGNLYPFVSSADFFFKINFFENFFQEYHQSVKQFISISGPTFTSLVWVTAFLQRLSADETGRQRVKWHKMLFGAFRFFQTRLNVNINMAFRVGCECCVLSYAPERVYRS